MSRDVLPGTSQAMVHLQRMEKFLTGQTSIVTGTSRNRGLGAAICRALSAAGSNIFFTGWPPYDASKIEADFPEKLSQELQGHGVQIVSVECDLAEAHAPEDLIEMVKSRFGIAHNLINNACYSAADDYSSISPNTLDKHYAINIRAPILLSAEFVRQFQGHGARRIVSMTSGQSYQPMPGELSYASTKGAIEAFTQTFSAEVAPFGILVNAVDPGPTDTGWMNDTVRAQIAACFPGARLNQPQDAASVVRFLLSTDADTITGQIIRARGGFR